MTDTDTDNGNDNEESKSYPAYFWEINEEWEDGVRSWRLFRETKTQKRIIRANVEVLSYDKFEDDEAVTNIAQYGFWNSVDPEQSFGERRDLRKEFVDAVAGLFIKAVAARDWNIDPLFEDLEWYEEQFVEDLRYLRNAANLGNPLSEEELREMYEDDPEFLEKRLERRAETVEKYGEKPPEIPDEVNEFIKHCRSAFKLTESAAYKPEEDGGHHPNPGEETDLTQFGGSDD
jgi:hypothetical protein